MAYQWLWLWIAPRAAWAARCSQEPFWAGVPNANGYPADSLGAPPHLTGLISGSLRLVKASQVLPEPAPPGAPPATQAGAVPPRLPGMATRPPPAPQEAQAAAPRRNSTRRTTKARRLAPQCRDAC